MKAWLPVRQIGKSHVSLTGSMKALKDGMEKRFESPLERDLLTIVDFDRNVRSFYDQPVTIPYTDAKGVEHTYTPDILIYFKKDRWPARGKCPLLVEVKTKRDLAERGDDYIFRFRAAERFAARKKWQFRVLTEDQIRTPYLSNARFLREYQKRDLPSGIYKLPMSHLRSIGESTVGGLLDHCLKLRGPGQESLMPSIPEDPDGRSRLLASIWRLVADCAILADFKKPLDLSSPISLPSSVPPAGQKGRWTHPSHYSPLWL